MPLFKEIKFEFGSEKIKIRVNVDVDGKFWFSPNDKIVEALNIEGGKVYFDHFKDANTKAHDIYQAYNDLKTEFKYVLRYKLTVSGALSSLVPENVQERVKRSYYRNHNQYFTDEEKVVSIEWFPAVYITKGEETVLKQLRKATPEDLEAWNESEEKRLEWLKIAYGVFQPFGEKSGAFLATKTVHGFYADENKKWYEIELTPDTLQFFENIDDSLVKIVINVLSLLGQDEPDLIETIGKLKDLSGGNLLLNK